MISFIIGHVEYKTNILIYGRDYIELITYKWIHVGSQIIKCSCWFQFVCFRCMEGTICPLRLILNHKVQLYHMSQIGEC